MARVRRSSLIAIAAALIVGLGAAVASSLPLGVSLSSGRTIGSLRIANAGPGAVTITRAVAVEARVGSRWERVNTEMNAVPMCAASSPALDQVRIASGGKLDAVPWRGFSCSGQCQSICRANIYYGGGPFRFVVTTIAPVASQVTGPAFSMPPRPRG